MNWKLRRTLLRMAFYAGVGYGTMLRWLEVVKDLFRRGV